eukprot:2136512-Ditylum_brightwellii.AAC.1
MNSVSLISPTKTTEQKKLQKATNVAASCTEPWYLDFQHPWFWYVYIQSDKTFVAVDLLMLPMKK